MATNTRFIAKNGLDNNSNSIANLGTQGNSLTIAGGAHAVTLTTTGATNVTVPTSGTLATTAQLPTVNNGTLTLAVSGSGLSGSASFTANQSGATTFTVTSNATNLNTASTIVARDASGNFTAGIITAALTGNASTATALQTARTINGVSFNGTENITIPAATSNAVTFDNGGTGAASGTTFDGSVARTISYNTIGASPLAGSASLTTTGTVTSGTWSGSFGAVSGANLTSLTAGNLTGTIPTAILGNSTLYVGTTAIALNRASANQALTGISSITLPGATSGTIQLLPTAVAGTTVLTLPATTGTVALTSQLPTVNNGTLTLNVSGTGLSGSASFTANQSTASTFTVTSNATSANTASTIVARDASGNFTAGTITAALSGNATTATTATNATNLAVTDDTTTATAVYPVWSNGTTGNQSLEVSSTKLTFVPSTGVLTATGFAGSGASLTNIPNAALTNSSITVGTTAIALGASSTTLAGLTSVTSTSFVGALTGNASTATALATGHTIGMTGDVSWTSAAFTGAGNVTGTSTLATVTQGAGSNFVKITLDTKGRVTGNTAVAAGDITTVLGYTPVNRAGDTMTGALVLSADPTAALGAATKQYVDNVASGLSAHAAVVTSTTATLATSSAGTVTYNNGTAGVGATLTTTGSFATIGAVATADGDRILVKNEATQAHNGVYVRTSATVLTRASDFDDSPNNEVAAGDFVYVQEGTLGGTQWVLTTTGDVVLGTTALVFSQLSGAGVVTGGTGITVTGNSVALATGNTLSLFNLATNGLVARTAANTVTARSIATSGTGLSVSNADGVAGNPTVTSNATNANTASTIVARDGSGNFSAGTITAALTGNASTATTLATARTIAISGAVTGTATSFNGSLDISIPVTAVDVGNASITGTLAADHGGTGISSYTAGDLIYASAATTFTKLAKGTASQALVMNAGATAPSWVTLDMSYLPGASSKLSARAATTAALTATYANGTAGVGATLTNSGTLAALVLDGITLAANDRVLVKDQASALQNGIYTVTNVGSISVAWVLTRTTDADAPAELAGAVINVDSGTTNGGRRFDNDFKTTDVIGTNNITWSRILDTGSIGVDVQAYDADLTTLGGLAKTDGNFIVGDGTNWVVESGATARTSLGLGTAATVNTGTSGATIPLLNGTNTWSGTQTFGTTNTTTLQIGGTSVTSTAAELNLLDTAVAGTVVNSKAVIYGAGGQILATNYQIGAMAATTGPILTYTLTSGGTLYTDGSYPNQVLSGGTGLYSTWDFTVAGGIVTVATLVGTGTAFTVGDTITIPALGGTGSGGLITVNTVRSVNSSTLSAGGGTMRLASTATSLTAGTLLGGIYFNGRDASAKGSGDLAYITAEAEGTSGGGSINLYTSANASMATKAVQVTGSGNFRLFNSAGTFYNEFNSEPTANRTLTIPDAAGTLLVAQSAAAAGYFDTSATTPTGTTRLNWGGYLYPTFLNLTASGDTATAATHYFVETASDGFVRPKTLANVKTEIVTTAAVTAAATTVGSNLFTLANPSAVTFLRVNADNTVSALNATDFRTAIGVTSGGITYTRITTATTLTNNQGVIADTTAAAFTVTLPAGATAGTQVWIADGGNWATNNLTIDPNGGTIEGFAVDENLVCNLGGVELQLIHDGTKWHVYSLAGTGDPTSFVPISGATMTGPLSVPASATGTQVPQVQEVVKKSGDTMTGALGQAAGTAALPSYTFSADTNTGMWSPGADTVAVSTAGTERLRIDASGHLLPGATNTYDLGSTSVRWRNIYTQDLHLSNGVGDYTVVEGEENLYLINNKSGKSFKFALIEVDPSEVPPKSNT